MVYPLTCNIYGDIVSFNHCSLHINTYVFSFVSDFKWHHRLFNMMTIGTHLIDKQCALFTNDEGLNTLSGHSYATDCGTYLYSFGVSHMKFNTTEEPEKLLWKQIWNSKHSMHTQHLLNIYPADFSLSFLQNIKMLHKICSGVVFK